MNAIRNVFTAFANLAASVNALASDIDGATRRLGHRLALDEALPALTHGEVIDADKPAPSTKRNGRTSKATALPFYFVPSADGPQRRLLWEEPHHVGPTRQITHRRIGLCPANAAGSRS
jgi:hypothetical protein